MIIVLYALIPLILVSVYRVFKGPTIWDRLLSLNMVSSKVILAIVLLGSVRFSRTIIDVAIIYTLLSFVGITFIASFMQKRNS